MMPHIVSIVYTPENIDQRPADRYARVAVSQATLVKGMGIQGDSKGRGGKRQLNVMLAGTVEQLRAEGFRTAPGELGEQIVIAGLESVSPSAGLRLHLGEAAVIEVTYPRTPCGRFSRIQGQPQETAQGRIGVLARVVQGGEIVVGDPVRVERVAEPIEGQ
jgi:MOSC domain-containing protein YiiM